MRSFTFALGVAFYITTTAAAPKKVQQPTISGATTQCYTSWDTTRLSTAASTKWQTTTTSYTSTTTSTDTSTTTPAPVTTTLTIQTATTITAPTSTSVQTDISITTTVATSTTTSTDISTATETSTSTPTLPAPSGFIPVQSSIAGSAWDGLSGTPSGKRSLSEALKAVLVPRSKAHYKQGVVCQVFVPENPAETAYATVTSTETALTPTSTAFSANTITSVIVPLASTTTTSTSTVTDTSVTTEVQSSTTTTTEISTATTSVLATCATNNFMDTINGQVVNGWSGFSQFTSQQLNSAYDCCQFAFSYSQPIANWVLRSGTCYLGINADGQCSQATELYHVQYGGAQGVAGNGPCGQGQA